MKNKTKNMFIKKGKTDWVLLVAVASIAGAAGGGLVTYINDTIMQGNMLSQQVPASVMRQKGIGNQMNDQNPIDGNINIETNMPTPEFNGVDGSNSAQ